MPTDPSPEHSNAFGAAEDADATRQAQHAVANDAPVDVNLNAIIGREQGATLTLMGKAFQSNADRREKIFDDLAAFRASKLA